MSLGLFAALLLAGCRAAPPPAAPRSIVRIALNGALTAAVGREYAAGLPNVDVQFIPATDSATVITALRQGTADVSFSSASTAYFSHIDTDPESSANSLLAIATMPAMSFHLLMSPKSGIRDVQGLRGRHLSMYLGGGGSPVVDVLLNAYGVTIVPRTIAETDQLSRAMQAAHDVVHSMVDAIVLIGDDPSPSVESAMRGGARLLTIQGPAVDHLRDEYPFIRRLSIPAGTYTRQTEAVPTLGIDTVLICRSNLDDALVHELTAKWFESFPRLVSLRPSLRLVDLQQTSATPIPLHPGAARYYREQELFR